MCLRLHTGGYHGKRSWVRGHRMVGIAMASSFMCTCIVRQRGGRCCKFATEARGSTHVVYADKSPYPSRPSRARNNSLVSRPGSISAVSCSAASLIGTEVASHIYVLKTDAVDDIGGRILYFVGSAPCFLTRDFALSIQNRRAGISWTSY
ncbi:hypothetical protein LX32DRAFT_111950 [Colletotrichum zoysiae]|uniref:Uncharacterized protein n=1 Tax=Colletotrichum zoysiae TaxID=1216348 RepID=A0AAD9LZZ5_9PEZI|nr:hypothetical protein LX32DRAFT_111950 [Colletotrichum zoysiae]